MNSEWRLTEERLTWYRQFVVCIIETLNDLIKPYDATPHFITMATQLQKFNATTFKSDA